MKTAASQIAERLWDATRPFYIESETIIFLALKMDNKRPYPLQLTDRQMLPVYLKKILRPEWHEALEWLRQAKPPLKINQQRWTKDTGVRSAGNECIRFEFENAKDAIYFRMLGSA